MHPFQQSGIGAAGRCHLGVLTGIAIYLVFTYPGALIPVLALLVAAVASEAMPPAWKRWLAGEALLIGAGAASYLYLVEAKGDSLHGWLRMLLAYWLLIPSRPGLLRWTVSLTMAEVVFLGSGQRTVTEIGLGHSPWGGTTVLAIPLLFLIPIALTSLGLDAWLTGRLGARSSNAYGHGKDQGASAWRTAIVPAFVLSLLLLAIAPWAIPHGERIPPKVNDRATSGIDRPRLDPGAHLSIIKDPTPKVRLLWEDGSPPLATGMVYLRAYTLPRLVVDGPLVHWEADALGNLRRASGGFHEDQIYAWVVRAPIGSDVILRPDPGGGVDLDDLVGDRHGNRYQTRLDESPRAYRVNMSADEEDPDEPTDPTYLAIPKALSDLPWAQIEVPTWRTLAAREASVQVVTFLQSLCTYSIAELPRPEGRPGGLLFTFLFGDASQRRGHCQYFASAAAVILRRLGHPTRCCAGFASTETTEGGYVFRGLNAHAWIEVRDEQGAWFRLDPTPPTFLIDNEAGASAEGPVNVVEQDPKKVVQDAVANSRKSMSPESRAIGFVLVLLLALAMALWIRRRLTAKTGTRLDLHQSALHRQRQGLERLAGELGVPFGPHSTLSDLAAGLGKRTGLDLTQHLSVHLAARYGDGALPPPWPVEELRKLAARRQDAGRPSGS